MQTVFRKGAIRAARVTATLAILALLWVCAPGQAVAGFCSVTSCTLSLTNSNFIGAGNFGTVKLALSSNVVTVDINLAGAYRIIKTGFPGAIGFADNLGGGLTIGNFKTGGAPVAPPSVYSGSLSSAPGCTTNDCHWGAFGYANDAAATGGPHAPNTLQELSFTVSKGTSITDVHQILQKFSPSGGNGSAYFVVDGCSWVPNRMSCDTGLFAVTRIPEPASLMILASGLLALGLLRWRRVI